jgi:UDPglucose 6-dehydrogenase
MRVAVIGTGYVGLVTGTCFAEMGNSVTCVDIDEQKIEQMNTGKVPIYEPGLEELFKKNIEENRLTFTTKLKDGIKDAEVIFLALPTPPAEDGSADLKYVLGVAEELGKKLDHYAVIVNKSTVPVGTAEKVKSAVLENSKIEFDVVSNPEFLKEGFAVADFMNPDRIVIGTKRAKARDVMLRLYEPLTSKGSEMFLMDEKSAEMTKYAANAFLATKISFMNEVANLCELVGADVDNVRLGIGSDTRIGKKFLYPGIGYGGSCFPKDVTALHRIAMENDYDFKILDAVSDVNNFQKRRIISKVHEYFDGNLEGRKVALWGLAFKAETDDIREAPSLEIIAGLLREGVTITAYDPVATDNVAKYFPREDNLLFAENQYDALKDAEILIIATEWNTFKNPDFTKMKELMAGVTVFDGRNLYDLGIMRENGFEYFSVGRRAVRP